MKKSIIFASLGLTVLIAACSKNNDSTPPVITDPIVDSVPTPTAILASHIWKIDTIAFDINGDGVIDAGVPGGLQACDMDNTLMFNKDSTGVFDEGSLKCVDSVAQSVPFTWYLKDSSSVINITGTIPGELHGDINVIKLNDTALVMSKPIMVSDKNIDLIISLKK